MKFKPLMETTKFEDLRCSGKLTRRQAHRIMASYGIASVAVPTLASTANASPDEQPVYFTWSGYDSPSSWRSTSRSMASRRATRSSATRTRPSTRCAAGSSPTSPIPAASRSSCGTTPASSRPSTPARSRTGNTCWTSSRTRPHSVVDGKRVYIPEDWGQTSMVIRTDLAPEYKDPENQTWTALWDEKYAGRMTISDYSYEAFTIAGLDPGLRPVEHEPGGGRQVRRPAEDADPARPHVDDLLDRAGPGARVRRARHRHGRERAGRHARRPDEGIGHRVDMGDPEGGRPDLALRALPPPRRARGRHVRQGP